MKFFELDVTTFHPRVPEAAVAAAVSAGGSVAAGFADVTVQLVGVPLPVLMAAVAGAFVVIAFAETSNAMRAAAVFLGLVIAGCAGAPLLEALSLWGAKRYGLEVDVPGGLRAFAALAIAASPFWVPRAWPYVKGFLPARAVAAATPPSATPPAPPAVPPTGGPGVPPERQP